MRFVCLFSSALLVAALLLVSCVEHQETPGMITESKALELAKKEFVRNGLRLEDYRVSVKTNSSGQNWIIWFDRKGEYSVPGGSMQLRLKKPQARSFLCLGSKCIDVTSLFQREMDFPS